MKALLAGGLVSTTCALIGCFIVLRRTSFLADAVAHSMLAGVVAGYLLMKLVYGDSAHTGAMLIGSIISGIITVAMVSFVSRASRVKEDAVIGIMYTGIFALGGVMVSFFSDVIHIDLYHFVIGSLLGVGDADLWMMGTVSCVVVVFIVMTFRWLQIITFDRVMAASIGIPVVLLVYAFVVDWRLGLLCLATFPIYALLQWWSMRGMTAKTAETADISRDHRGQGIHGIAQLGDTGRHATRMGRRLDACINLSQSQGGRLAGDERVAPSSQTRRSCHHHSRYTA